MAMMSPKTHAVMPYRLDLSPPPRRPVNPLRASWLHLMATTSGIAMMEHGACLRLGFLVHNTDRLFTGDGARK